MEERRKENEMQKERKNINNETNSNRTRRDGCEKKGIQLLKIFDSKQKEEGIYGAVSELPHLRAL
jgi:hypothetical protein